MLKLITAPAAEPVTLAENLRRQLPAEYRYKTEHIKCPS